jgi:hypothetical protein
MTPANPKSAISNPEYPPSLPARELTRVSHSRYLTGSQYPIQVPNHITSPTVIRGISRNSLDLDSTHLQHVQQGSLAGVIQTEEKELGMLVQKAKRSQDIVN